MARPKKKSTDDVRRSAPAHSPEARENQMIALAMDVASKRMREGTASSQVVTHFLKLGSMREELEKEKLQQENELLRAKTESLQSSKRVEELYKQALSAMSAYSGTNYDEGAETDE